MNKLISRSLSVFLILFAFSINAQTTDKERFLEALYLIDENRYAQALPLLQEVYKNDKGNANVNYCLGLSILKSFDEKEKKNALGYLEMATKNVSANYTYIDAKEKKAPVDAWFYLAKAQHSDYQFDEAVISFNKFRTYVNDKHFLYKEIDKGINQSNYAKYAVRNPVSIKTNNLGNGINGYDPDFSPVVRIDESAIYYTSRRLRKDSSNYGIYDPIDGMYYEDIYVSYKEEDGSWSEPSALNINTDEHEATVNLSIDGQTLYIYKDVNGNGELFESQLEDDSAGIETWSEPKKLGSNINTKAYETHVTITPDGKRLYFISDREGGYGEKDIYFCNRLPNGKWALAQNAGPVLNSDHNEDGVYMHPDGKTMYFSSDGHKSMGGYDIMYSTMTDTGWTVPTNMGYPINSVDDDVFFVTTPDGKRAYFSSFKEEGYGEKDIYMLELIDAEETGLTLYRGEFTFKDRRVPPSGAEVSITNNYTGANEGYYTPRQRDGQFTAILEANNSYHFIYQADGYETYEEDIYVTSAGNYQEIYKDIKLRPVRVGDGMVGITPNGMNTANINGGVTKKGVPLRGLKIVLFDEGNTKLSETTSDNTGDFQFAELDATKPYLIRVFSDEGNPLRGTKVEVVNDRGEILPFEPLDDTTYIFTPSIQPYEFYGIKNSRSLAGAIKKNGVPIEGLRVKLQDDSKNTIQDETTDGEGLFNFAKLELDKEYRIVFDGDFPDDPEILITNDLGQQMKFLKVNEGVYQYVPINTPMPKALLTDIGGNVTSAAGYPVQNIQVLLLAADQSLLNSASTDNVGKFNFIDLDLTKRYFIRFQGNFPSDMKMVVANENFDLLLFRKIEEGLYQYDPVFVRLQNAQSQVLGKEVTENVNNMDFKKLKLDEYYQIIFEGNYPDDTQLVFTNEEGEKFNFLKFGDGKYQYVPEVKDENYFILTDASGSYIAYRTVRLENSNRVVIEKVVSDSRGKFKFRKLKADETLWVVVEGEDIDSPLLIIEDLLGTKLEFNKSSSNNYRYVPTFDYLTQNGLKAYTIDTQDNLDFQETYPRPEELKDVIAYFQKYFTYNMKDISENNKEFVSFINDIAELVKQRGDAKIIITSSASKVPTRTWKTNSVLTKKRAYDTKALLEKLFKKAGISSNQFNFVDINTLITGPGYKGDYIENRSTYEKYQYVRIFVK